MLACLRCFVVLRLSLIFFLYVFFWGSVGYYFVIPRSHSYFSPRSVSSVNELSGEMVQEKLTGQTAIEQLTSGHISPFGDGQGFF